MIDHTALPDPGDVPVLDWINVDLIGVEPMYQRPLDAGRVDAILKSFSWRSFGALVVVPQPDGRYHATDGQHRLEAARLHPMVSYVPAVIVKADDVHAEAGIFVDINRNRKNVSALELFFAKLTAEDDDALTVFQVCQKAGVRIPKHPGDYKIGDSIAVAAIQSVIDKHGAMRARERIQVLVAARHFAPITAAHIKAVDLLLTDPEFSEQITIEDLTAALVAHGDAVDADIKRFAQTHRVPAWQAMANVWFQKCKKRRAPAGRAA